MLKTHYKVLATHDYFIVYSETGELKQTIAKCWDKAMAERIRDFFNESEGHA